MFSNLQEEINEIKPVRGRPLPSPDKQKKIVVAVMVKDSSVVGFLTNVIHL